MFCMECGTNLTSTQVYCSNCGTKTSSPHSSVSTGVETEVEAHLNGIINNQKQELPKSAKITVMFIMLCIVILGIFFLNYQNSDQYLVDQNHYDSKEEQAEALKAETNEPKPPQAQQQNTAKSPSNIARDYGMSLANELERSYHPGCQALASSIRMIAYSSKPPDIVIRQVEAMFSSAPSICFAGNGAY